MAMAGGAWAQSLLGDSDRSPYDPAPPRKYRKHDVLSLRGDRPKADGGGGFAIAAEVADVRPNGTLVVQARKRRIVNGREEVFKLTGEVPAAAVKDGAARLEDVLNLSLVCEGLGGPGEWILRAWP
jgi:hypothetical protein